MKLLAISEHYFPRVGGTVNYVHETLSELSRQGVNVELFVPGPPPDEWIPEGIGPLPYQVTWIDAGYPKEGDPTREQRYAFCQATNVFARDRALSADPPDLLHVMFGMFLMEVLDTNALRLAGMPSVATVHNVPPQECRLVAPDAPFYRRMKEDARLQFVGWKNRNRLRAHRYDALVVPSEQVRSLLTRVLSQSEIDVVGHGPTGALLATMRPPASRRPEAGAPVKLLTAGGYAPHKRQHIIPDAAKQLLAQGVAFEWDIVGPEGRVAGYFEKILRSVKRAGLERQVRVRSAVPFHELARLYDGAHLYVQPSIEEGFCITALDAAASGMPVIASPAGALPRISEVSGGDLIACTPRAIAEAISGFFAEDRWRDAADTARRVREEFSWRGAAEKLRKRYESLIGQNGVRGG